VAIVSDAVASTSVTRRLGRYVSRKVFAGVRGPLKVLRYDMAAFLC
jgi:hypothetical protein